MLEGTAYAPKTISEIFKAFETGAKAEVTGKMLTDSNRATTITSTVWGILKSITKYDKPRQWILILSAADDQSKISKILFIEPSAP